MLDQNWMKEFTREYQKRVFEPYGIEYAINARVNTMNDELIKRMKQSGCREIRIGFETGDPKLRKEILNKPITDEQLINAFNLCHKYDIRGSAFAMLGIPRESHESIEKTLKMLAKLRPYLIRLTFLFPYYHTGIYEYCESNDLFRKDASHVDEFTISPLKFENLKDDEILKYKHMFPWYLNTVLNPEHADDYHGLINDFSKLSYKRFLDSNDDILSADEKISLRMQDLGVEHYRYFRNNLYYYQRWSP